MTYQKKIKLQEINSKIDKQEYENLTKYKEIITIAKEDINSIEYIRKLQNSSVPATVLEQIIKMRSIINNKLIDLDKNEELLAKHEKNYNDRARLLSSKERADFETFYTEVINHEDTDSLFSSKNLKSTINEQFEKVDKIDFGKYYT